MTDNVQMNPSLLLIGDRAFSRYAVCAAFGCRIVHGPIPVDHLDSLRQGYSPAALCDLRLASWLGASLVIGEPDRLEELRAALPLEAHV